MKIIPLDVVDMIIYSNSRKQKKKVKESRYIIHVHRETRDALNMIKHINNVSSLSNTIDLLISNMALEQYADGVNEKEIVNITKKQMVNGGTGRQVTVHGQEFYSIAQCAKHFKCSRNTVVYRIQHFGSKYRGWNYSDEDLDIKYSDRRVD